MLNVSIRICRRPSPSTPFATTPDTSTLSNGRMKRRRLVTALRRDPTSESLDQSGKAIRLVVFA